MLGLGLVATVAGIAWAGLPSPLEVDAAAETVGESSDQDWLGTIEVNGSAGAAVPLPKLAVEPLLTHGQADEVVQLVANGDFLLSGQFDLLGAGAAPAGPFVVEQPPDLVAWQRAAAEYLVRVYAERVGQPDASLVGEVYLTQPRRSADAGAAAVTPVYRTRLPLRGDLRTLSHRLVDLLLGALTGRPGGFASRMAYAADVGSDRQVFVLDADGFNLHTASPPLATALSPAFGPDDVVFYALSRSFSRFRLASTPSGVLAPLQVPGSLMGLAFSADRQRMLLVAMDEGESTVYLVADGHPRRYARASYANHPAFGPGGRIAYVAGSPVQRVYVDHRAISPAGLMASSPAFCETPEGLLVFFTVKTRTGFDIVATYPNGHGLRRFTKDQGSNWDGACSSDGRLLAFFSSRKLDQGPGLYLAPITRPWMARRILGQLGDSLRWQAMASVPPASPAR